MNGLVVRKTEFMLESSSTDVKFDELVSLLIISSPQDCFDNFVESRLSNTLLRQSSNTRIRPNLDNKAGPIKLFAGRSSDGS
jgi:hypothetical protein